MPQEPVYEPVSNKRQRTETLPGPEILDAKRYKCSSAVSRNDPPAPVSDFVRSTDLTKEQYDKLAEFFKVWL